MRLAFFLNAALAMLMLGFCPATAQGGFFDFGPAPRPAQLRWRLENPFRLFRNPADTLPHRRAYLSLSRQDRETSPVFSAEHLLQAEAGPRGWASAIHGDTCFDERTGRYLGCASYIRPPSHKVLVKLNKAAANNAPCTWTLSNALKRPIRRIQGPCAKEEKFDIPYPAGGAIEVRQGQTLIARQFIRVEDILIVGLGDSIGSGEGNPDEPVQFEDKEDLTYGRVILAREGWFKWPRRLTGYPRRAGSWDQVFDRRFEDAGAGWLDEACHRSLYSYQARVALQLAVENDQRAVTFVSYACTGADTLDGIFLTTKVRECAPGKDVKLISQLSALSRELCRKEPEKDILSAELSKIIPEIKAYSEEKRQILRCPGNDFLRKPDLLLVSLGGNDIGFSEMVADALLHKNSVYRRLAEQLDSVHGTGRGAEKLQSLPQRYNALGKAFSLYLGLPEGAQQNVLITSYPDMGYAEDGRTICKGSSGMEVFPAFQFDETRVAKIEKLSEDLYATLQKSAMAHGWTVVDDYRTAFRTHGLCATSHNGEPADTLSMPFHGLLGWSPFKPSSYRAYAMRQRWVRTPNDAFMTVNYHQRAFGRAQCINLGAIVQNPFQLFLAGTYGGAFHPTAEGHAVIADAVLKRARETLRAKRVATVR